MFVRALLDPETQSLSYLLADPQTRDAVIIDPVRRQVDRDIALLDELGLQLRYSIDTHLHTDHVTGAGSLRVRLGSSVVMPAGAETPRADLQVSDGDTIEFGRQALEVRSTPGHGAHAISLVSADSSVVFTGDTLLARSVGRCDAPGASVEALRASILDRLYTLPATTVVHPGHVHRGAISSTIGEERALNPLVREQISLGQLVERITDLGGVSAIDLEMLAANEKCGMRPHTGGDPRERNWAPIRRTATGIPEVGPDWLHEHVGEFRVVDVRGEGEFFGPLGHIEGSELVPLQTLQEQAQAWNRRAAIVTVCRSGGRSAAAANLLERMGFVRVASMRGGMGTWNALGQPTAAN